MDSYLGVFGKQVVDGTAMDGGLQDALLLIALGVSVLIGVFASQLANETWDSINEEIEIDKAEKAALEGNDEDGKDGIIANSLLNLSSYRRVRGIRGIRGHNAAGHGDKQAAVTSRAQS